MTGEFAKFKHEICDIMDIDDGTPEHVVSEGKRRFTDIEVRLKKAESNVKVLLDENTLLREGDAD